MFCLLGLTIWSVLIFHEKMTGQKLAGILLCFIGSVLAITGGHMELEGFTIGGARLRLTGQDAITDNSQSQQIIKQLRTELEEVIKILRS